MSISVKATHSKELGAWVLHFSFSKYDKPAFDGMKAVLLAKVPASQREYDAATREWTILEQHWDILKAIFKDARCKVTEEKPLNTEDFFYNTRPEPVPVTRASLASQLEAFGFTTEILKDSDLSKKTYRKLALAFHPDRNNGDGSKMAELNSIWSAYNGQ